MSPKDFYAKRLENFQSETEKLKKQSNALSTQRLVVFFLGCVLSYICFNNLSSSIGWLSAVVFLAGFFVLVNRHSIVKQRLERTECKARINEAYLDRLNGNWKEFSDKGSEFVNPDHPFSQDLDIFGDKSLFQYLNLTRTYYGRKKLGQMLSSPHNDTKLILKHQGMIRELASKVEFSQELQCEGMLNKKIGGNPEPLFLASEDQKKFFKRKWTENIFYILPAATLLSLFFASLYAFVPPFVPVLFIIIQLIIMAVSFRKTNAVLEKVSKFKNDIMVYGKMIRLIEAEVFADDALKELQSHLNTQDAKASKRIKKLEGISEAVDIRLSPLLAFLMNLFFLWDFHCIFAFEEWKKQNGQRIRLWVETIGAFESSLSLAVLAELHPKWCYPDVSIQKPFFRAAALGHPLILEDARVLNDVEVKDQLCVITGSNMSGKTTLLRTIGINLVLAYAGAPVCSSAFSCAIMKILTSMRINDDLSSGISTFYAELLRIKMIIKDAKNKEHMIFLIDELFRGTNSKDRITGAIQVMKALNRDWIIGLISTHDFELCELEKESRDRIKNYHFTESYSENKIHFDYKLRTGRSTTTNARYLMKMVGIDTD